VLEFLPLEKAGSHIDLGQHLDVWPHQHLLDGECEHAFQRRQFRVYFAGRGLSKRARVYTRTSVATVTAVPNPPDPATFSDFTHSRSRDAAPIVTAVVFYPYTPHLDRAVEIASLNPHPP
jgi:hypothetical protein